jgi:flagellar basal body-associated protein FliL
MGKLIPIVGAAVVALLVGAGAGWFLGTAVRPAPAAAAQEAESEPEPHYVEYLIKDRTVTLADPGARRYLKISLVLQVLPTKKVHAAGDGAVMFVAATYSEAAPAGDGLVMAAGGGAKAPELPNNAQVQHVLTTVLSAKRVDELATPDGRERLREELKAKINQVMPKDQQVVNVLYVDFIIQ